MASRFRVGSNLAARFLPHPGRPARTKERFPGTLGLWESASRSLPVCGYRQLPSPTPNPPQVRVVPRSCSAPSSCVRRMDSFHAPRERSPWLSASPSRHLKSPTFPPHPTQRNAADRHHQPLPPCTHPLPPPRLAWLVTCNQSLQPHQAPRLVLAGSSQGRPALLLTTLELRISSGAVAGTWKGSVKAFWPKSLWERRGTTEVRVGLPPS